MVASESPLAAGVCADGMPRLLLKLRSAPLASLLTCPMPTPRFTCDVLVSRMASFTVGVLVPMPTLPVLVLLMLPAVSGVVHCARASREWESAAPSASRQSAAVRATFGPRLSRWLRVSIFVLHLSFAGAG